MLNLQVIAMIGATAHIIARTFFGLAETPTGFYAGGAVSSIGCIALPVIKSMISKMVETSEKGKVFAWVSVFSNSVLFFSGIIYSRVCIYCKMIGEMPYNWETMLSDLHIDDWRNGRNFLVYIIHTSFGVFADGVRF